MKGGERLLFWSMGQIAGKNLSGCQYIKALREIKQLEAKIGEKNMSMGHFAG